MNGNEVINARIKHFTNRKEDLLKMKKAERRGELKPVEETIARLKRWKRELETQRAKEAGQKMAKACEKTVKACQEFTKAVGTLEQRKNVRGVNPMKYK